MTAPTRAAFGSATRAIVSAALDAGDRAVDRVVVESLVLTYVTDAAESERLLKRILDPTRVAAWGYQEIPAAAQRAPELAAAAPDLVVALYATAFGHEEDSTEVTSMRGGIMPLTSNRGQDFGMARYALGVDFAKVIAADEDAAVKALHASSTIVARRRARPSDNPPVDVNWAGGSIRLISDNSGWWDVQSHEHDLGAMLSAFERRVEALASDEAGLAGLLQRMEGMEWPAVVLARILSAAAAAPSEPASADHDETQDDAGSGGQATAESQPAHDRSAVRAAARDLLGQRTVLMHGDLELAAARAFAAVFADADEATRRELEQVALDLPARVSETGERGERLRQAAEYRRDQLLGFVDPDRLVSTAARERRAELDAEESGPPPVARDRIPSWRPPEPVAAPAMAEGARVNALLEPLRGIYEARLANADPPVPATKLLDPVRSVIAELATVQDIDAHTRQEAELLLGEVAKAIGRRPIGEPTPDERAVMREVARRLQDAADPDAGDDARWDSELPAVPRFAPRADAARIWLLLAAHGEHDDELLDGIRRAARDESPEVRRRVAEAAWWLRDTEEHVAWELAEQLAAAEPRWNVAVTNLDNLRALATLDRERAFAAVVSLHRRMLAAVAPNWAVAASSVQLLAHWVDDGAAAGHEELDRVVNLAATDPDRAEHAISPWRQILTAGDDTEEATARRSRAIEMWTRIAEATLTPFERLITADDRNEDQLKALGHLLLKIAAEVQFAAGASGLDRDTDDWQPTAEQHARLWQEASPLLDAACRIGIPAAADDIVKTLASYVDHDPKGVLRRLTKVLATAEPFGYQNDRLAETSFNGLVVALLSRQRDVIVADADTRARLLDALASFVRAGSGSARRTVLGLDDLLR
jgi:hypothetical protein